MITKEKLLNYLTYETEEINLLQLLQWLEVRSKGAIKVTKKAKEKEEWELTIDC